MIQETIIAVIVAGAVGYLAWYFRRSKSKTENAHGCPNCTVKKQKLSR